MFVMFRATLYKINTSVFMGDSYRIRTVDVPYMLSRLQLYPTWLLVMEMKLYLHITDVVNLVFSTGYA